MRTLSLALQAHLAAVRSSPGGKLNIADCFTITLQNGLVIRTTSADLDIVFGGQTYKASGLAVTGLKYKCAVGLQAEEQEIVILARGEDKIGTAPALGSIAGGVLEFATVARDRLYFTDYVGGSLAGSVNLFTGRVIKVESMDDASATVSVSSDLILLANDMPTTRYSVTCNHVLYDSGCGLNRSLFSASGTAASGTTRSSIVTGVGSSDFDGGYIEFTSGACSGLRMTIKSANGSLVNLLYPLLHTPAVGDAFTIYKGCAHTKTVCNSKFNNLPNFRGFPDVPPPTFAI